MSNYHLQTIWRHIERVISSAKRLHFIGYSFPDADIHLKYLLKRAEVNRGRTWCVYIANNHDDKSPFDADQELRRYRRFFRSGWRHVSDTKLSFQELAGQGLPE